MHTSCTDRDVDHCAGSEGKISKAADSCTLLLASLIELVDVVFLLTELAVEAVPRLLALMDL